MPSYFFDSSALAKAYREETGTENVNAMLTEVESQFWISSLTIVEFQSVFAQKVRERLITAADFYLLRRKFGGDLRAHRILVKGILRRHQRAAEKLLITHAPLRRLRTLDALQLAVVSELWADEIIQYFVVADRHLADVARLEGIKVLNPDLP